MSYTAYAFFRRTTRHDVGFLLRTTFGVTLTEIDTGLGVADVGDVFGVGVAILGEHDFDDDRELNFSDYPYAVAFKLSSNVMEPTAGCELCVALAKALARTARHVTKAEYMVVEELQKVIERG